MEEYIKNSPADTPKPSYPTGPYIAITPQPTRRTAVEATWINKYLNRQAQFCSGDMMSQSALAVTYLDLMRHAIQAARYKELQTLDRLFEKWIVEGKFDIDTYTMTQVPLQPAGSGQVSGYRYQRPDLEKKEWIAAKEDSKGKKKAKGKPSRNTNIKVDGQGRVVDNINLQPIDGRGWRACIECAANCRSCHAGCWRCRQRRYYCHVVDGRECSLHLSGACRQCHGQRRQ